MLLQQSRCHTQDVDSIVNIGRNDDIAVAVISRVHHNVRCRCKTGVIELDDILSGMEIRDGVFSEVRLEDKVIAAGSPVRTLLPSLPMITLSRLLPVPLR